MRLHEALEKFDKIRMKGWYEGLHIKYSKEECKFYYFGPYADEREVHLSPGKIMSEDWEEYVEPRKYLTHKEAMQALIDGKKLRKEWTCDVIYFLNSNGFSVKKINNIESNISMIFYEDGFSERDRFFIAE